MRYFNLGLELAVAVALFTVGGVFLDRWMKTLPLFTVIGSCIGIVVGGYLVYKETMRLIRGSNGRRDNKKTDTL
ncbi:MAG: AtpZ/AtpI family protein [Spirochaetota bacterium]